VAAVCWGGACGLGAGHLRHQLWLLWLGSGLIAALAWAGLHLTVSTLIKWFPMTRHGHRMASWFWRGALIGAPLADCLINHFKAPGAAACGRPS